MSRIPPVTSPEFARTIDRSVATLARREMTFCCARPIFDGCRRVAPPAFKYSGALAGRLATIKRADYASHFLLPLTTNAFAWNETSCKARRRRRARCQVIRDISPGCVLYLTELYFSGMKEIDIAIHNQCIEGTDLAQAIIPVPGFMCVIERPHNTPLLSSNKDGVSSKTGRPHAMHDSLMRKVHYDHCLARIAS